MIQSVDLITLVVREYDEAIAFYRDKLGFHLVVDTQVSPEKRWVVLEAPGRRGARLLLGRAATDEQKTFIGRQTGGRVFLFFETDNFAADYAALQARGVRFVREPKTEDFGTVAVFEDLYGNWIDLIEYSTTTPNRRSLER
jgi:catechol 2,3-dioxygenase-like lactoylglutathione lyase family enzyme